MNDSDPTHAHVPTHTDEVIHLFHCPQARLFFLSLSCTHPTYFHSPTLCSCALSSTTWHMCARHSSLFQLTQICKRSMTGQSQRRNWGRKLRTSLTACSAALMRTLPTKHHILWYRLARRWVQVGGAGTVDCVVDQQTGGWDWHCRLYCRLANRSVGLALQIVLLISKKVGGAGTVDCVVDQQTGRWGWHCRLYCRLANRSVGLALQIVLQISKKVGAGGWGWH